MSEEGSLAQMLNGTMHGAAGDAPLDAFGVFDAHFGHAAAAAAAAESGWDEPPCMLALGASHEEDTASEVDADSDDSAGGGGLGYVVDETTALAWARGVFHHEASRLVIITRGPHHGLDWRRIHLPVNRGWHGKPSILRKKDRMKRLK